MSAPPEPEQPALLGLDDVPGASATRRTTTATPLADVDPVARVVLDLQPAHLDREYDYLVPAAMADSAVPGVRVRARFGPQEVAGYVVARAATSDHDGRLQPLRRVVSADPVLTSEVLALARAVAQRYAGTLTDVLRLAVPPRHARVEGEVLASLDAAGTPAGTPGVEPPSGPGFEAVWAPYQGGEAFCRRILAGEAPRAVWTPLPGLESAPDHDVARVPHWAAAVAQAVRAAVGGGRRALVVVPDARDVALAADALAACGVEDVVRLQADDGPAPRYRAFLRARHGLAAVVVGTRAAMFAPLPDLGLVVLWGDGEQTLAEPHAPYPHARDVLALRSEQQGAAFLLGSPGRTVQAQALVARGWAHDVAPPRDVLRSRAPRVRALTSIELARDGAGAAARLPTAAWRVAKDALAHGPVLVQVPRTGYVPVVACARCRTAARCTACHGPLGLRGAGSTPQCTWCGRLDAGWRCDECGDDRVRAVRVGSERTAEELGRAFPGVPVRVSSSLAAGGVLDRVDARPALVVATPGAEPVPDGGYVAALLLDAAVTGDPAAVRAVVDRVALADDRTVLGPVDLPGDGTRLEAEVRVVVRVPTGDGLALATQLRASLAVRSARREGGRVRVQLDPPEIL